MASIEDRWRGKCFARRTDAEQFRALKERARVKADILAADSDGIDPAGYYVYLLWAVRDDDAPVYVGSTGNILQRLGAHLGDYAKRAGIGWITLIRCTSERAMEDREAALIRRYRPRWNRDIPLEDGRHLRSPGAARFRALQEEHEADIAWQQLKAAIGRAARKNRGSHGPGAALGSERVS
jgi:GIY-YIG catalytic domain